MAVVYLIGGTPRTGKTTLTMQFIQRKPILATSADAIRYSLRQIVKTTDQPDLFRFIKYISNDPKVYQQLKNNPEKAMDIQIRESVIIWRSIKDFIHSNLEDGRDVLIEGLAIMPEFVQQLSCDCRAVFLGNQSAQHVKTILRFARNNPHDWMYNLEDDTIATFASLNQTYSRLMEKEASKYGLPYVEIHDDTFSTDIDTALRLLLQ